MKRILLAIGILLGIALPAFSTHKCGTALLLEQLRNRNKNTSATLSENLSARVKLSSCTDSDFYDSVYSRTTEHFQIFFTLNGPHRTTFEYVDSLAKALEYAWDFHVRKQGMKAPLGHSPTILFEQTVKESLFPVEVVDMGYQRTVPCRQCYGFAHPFDNGQSQLAIENDFKYAPTTSQVFDTISINGKNCAYVRSTVDFENVAHGYSYAKNFMQALRVTAAHELYHTIQFRYIEDLKNPSYWLEAAAAGIENVVAPDVDDYFIYLPKMASNVGTPLSGMESDYGAGLLFLYLYHHVAHNIDKLILESFGKYPSKAFQYQLTQVASKKKLSADSLFHDFATRLVLSGELSSHADSSFWIDPDQPRWPEFRILPKESHFEADALSDLAYMFYYNGTPDLAHLTGRASAMALSQDAYRIRFLPTSNSVDSTFTEFSGTVDSVLWVVSRFTETDAIPTVFKDSTLRAYPSPWRHGPLCFTPLPQNKDFIEIRNRRGNLVEKIKYENYTQCIDEARVKSLLAPGVYRFRVGNSGKLKDFIVIY